MTTTTETTADAPARAQYIIRAFRDSRLVREDVFESFCMHAALEDAKQAWQDVGRVGWLALKGEDYPRTLARLITRRGVQS